jgi:hypothetical protein
MLILGVVVLAFFLIVGQLGGGKEKAVVLVVEVNGKEVMRIPLSRETRQYQVDGYVGKSTFLVEDFRVRMVDSACPDKLCVHTGWIGSSGDSIVCLPNRVVLRLEGMKDGLDIVQR